MTSRVLVGTGSGLWELAGDTARPVEELAGQVEVSRGQGQLGCQDEGVRGAPVSRVISGEAEEFLQRGVALAVDDREGCNRVVFAARGGRLEAFRPGPLRRPRGLDAAVWQPLLGELAHWQAAWCAEFG